MVFCFPPAPEITMYRGYEIIPTFNHDLENVFFINIVSGLFILIIAVLAYTQRSINMSAYRKFLIIYCVYTSLFTMVRAYFDFSRFMLVTATLHNSMEWALMLALVMEESQIGKYFYFTQGWIFFIIMLVFSISSLKTLAIIEEIAGNGCDSFLLLVFIYRYLDKENSPNFVTFLFFLLLDSHFTKTNEDDWVFTHISSYQSKSTIYY